MSIATAVLPASPLPTVTPTPTPTPDAAQATPTLPTSTPPATPVPADVAPTPAPAPVPSPNGATSYVLGPALPGPVTVPTPGATAPATPGATAPAKGVPTLAIDSATGTEAHCHLPRYDLASSLLLVELRIYFAPVVNGVPAAPLADANAYLASSLPYATEDITPTLASLSATTPGGPPTVVGHPNGYRFAVSFAKANLTPGVTYTGQTVLGLK